MTTDGLFDMEPMAVPVDELVGLSPDQRRTVRQRQNIKRGLHPVSGWGLHAEAPRVTHVGQQAPGPRCGDCRFLHLSKHHDRSYLKCDVVGVTNGAGTDMRRWWPACTRWEAS